jgi:hypothetical protein
MIILAIGIVYLEERGYNMFIRSRDWLMLILGSLIVILSFVVDGMHYLSPDLVGMRNYRPMFYNWFLFWIGEGVIVLGMFIYFKRTINKNENRFKILSEEHA